MGIISFCIKFAITIEALAKFNFSYPCHSERSEESFVQDDNKAILQEALSY
jgi:hypothetical protein